jgi:hypothetical protein
MPIYRCFHLPAEPGHIFLADAERTDGLELQLAAQPPLDFTLVLYQHLHRTCSDSPQADYC